MDDFFVYYEAMPNDVNKGVIKAISPNEISGMEMEHIRIPSELGLSFTVGNEALNFWVVAWDNDEGKMALTKTQEVANTTEILFLEEIPRKQKKPQLRLTYSRASQTFTVLTRGVSISHQNVNLQFFVTKQGDPNILHHYFSVALYDSMSRRGITVECPVELDTFSVFTRPELERYQLKVVR